MTTLLTAIGAELNACASVASRLQGMLTPIDFAGVDVETLQSLDSLTQTLVCLADFATELAGSTPPEISAGIEAALGRVSLGELSRRLAGRAPADLSADAEVFG